MQLKVHVNRAKQKNTIIYGFICLALFMQKRRNSIFDIVIIVEVMEGGFVFIKCLFVKYAIKT
jgi:hypothetical protein